MSVKKEIFHVFMPSAHTSIVSLHSGPVLSPSGTAAHPVPQKTMLRPWQLGGQWQRQTCESVGHGLLLALGFISQYLWISLVRRKLLVE